MTINYFQQQEKLISKPELEIIKSYKDERNIETSQSKIDADEKLKNYYKPWKENIENFNELHSSEARPKFIFSA